MLNFPELSSSATNAEVSSDQRVSLTDNEATFLALLIRLGPITAYQAAKMDDESPVSNFKTSKGKLYPIVTRLRRRGLIRAHRVPGDGRKTATLESTEKGHQAFKQWLMEIRSTHLLLEDPLRTKVQSFDMLTRDERIRWIVELKACLHGKLAEVEEYAKNVATPQQEFVHDNAVRALRSRMDWLDQVLRRVVTRDG